MTFLVEQETSAKITVEADSFRVIAPGEVVFYNDDGRSVAYVILVNTVQQVDNKGISS